MDKERRSGYNRGPREICDAVCSDCGKQTQIPFKLNPGRLVYCKQCIVKNFIKGIATKKELLR